MTINVFAIENSFAGRVDGVDLSRAVDDDTFETIRDAFHRYAVLVISGQDTIDDAAQVAFSRRFGPLEQSIRFDKSGGGQLPEISNLTNVDEDGSLYPLDDPRARYHAGNAMWHTDSSFKPVPANASLLSGRVVPPEGGDTEFADARAAYDALPEARKVEIEDLVVEHSIIYSRRLMGGDVIFNEADREALAPVHQVLVRTHPATRRKALYTGAHASHVIGWPVEKGRALLKELMDHTIQDRFVWRHAWSAGDLVMWDNRCVLHRGRPFAADRYPRTMRRTTVAGDGPTVVEEAAQ
jgi:alpha-ketoglutarate-dependent 2,4-dichlorophenoxyacetate dioxygenase